MDKINWGIIGCGDVTEVKSGPAFNKVPGSALVAVMRRDEAKVKDYAERHQVPKWYTRATDLVHDPEINAIYIATPTSSHEEYALAAIDAGKPVYLEKPMAIDAAAAERINKAAQQKNIKLVVAHYRRQQPFFQKIRQLILANTLGAIKLANIEFYRKALTASDLATEKMAWRVDPAIGGGGLFNDMAPHQLDILHYLFGEAEKVNGVAGQQGNAYNAADVVAGSILFKSRVLFNGAWCFNLQDTPELDRCEITGEKGSIRFSFFDQGPLKLTLNGHTEEIKFDPLQHVQQPMIESVVNYFLEKGDNPCTGEEGVTVMQWIDAFTGK